MSQHKKRRWPANGKATWYAWGQKCGRHYHLSIDGHETDYYVHHCGHPTALWPYYITVERFLGVKKGWSVKSIYAPNGRGFHTVAEARAEAERRAREEGRQ